MEIGKEHQLLSTQNEYDFVNTDGNLTPSAADTLMFVGYCLRAYEIEQGEPLKVDNNLIKELILNSVEEDTIPAIIVGIEDDSVVLQGELRDVDGD